MLPLEGITAVALEHAVAAPFATRHLADLGARVIKIERHGSGDFARGYDDSVHGLSSYFVWLNRGKESVQLDLKSPDGRALLDRLVSRADIFISNLAPGALTRLALDPIALRPRYPRLITCTISGYGREGPYADRKAYDLLIQCETGLLSVTGTAADPAKVGISIADIATGMYAYSGLLTALYERQRTGRGSDLEVAMIDALGEWVSQPYLYARYSGRSPGRTAARHATIAPYGPYRTGDGSVVFLGVQNDREWASLCRHVLSSPDLISDTRFATNILRVANNEDLTPLIEAALRPYDTSEVLRRLDDAGIANARLRSVAEFGDHPQLAARARWREVPTPSGPVTSLLPPVVVTGQDPAMQAVPALGEHTERLRAEFPDAQGPADRDHADTPDEDGSPRTDPATLNVQEVLTPGPARALAALFNEPALPTHTAAPLPPLWHWIYLLDSPQQSDLGPDGHTTRGIPTPPAPGLRRMFAGGRLHVTHPLTFGTPVTRRTHVAQEHTKHGRSGILRFLTVHNEWLQDGRVALVDEQDLVYRPQPGAGSRTTGRTSPDRSPDTAEPIESEAVIDVDTTLLFRFSALTYNAHRIHYDRDFAQQEGYPDIVVHGPLQALWMAEHLRAHGVSLVDRAFTYRMVRPMFGSQPVRVSAHLEANTWMLRVRDAAGTVTATGVLANTSDTGHPNHQS